MSVASVEMRSRDESAPGANAATAGDDAADAGTPGRRRRVPPPRRLALALALVVALLPLFLLAASLPSPVAARLAATLLDGLARRGRLAPAAVAPLLARPLSRLLPPPLAAPLAPPDDLGPLVAAAARSLLPRPAPPRAARWPLLCRAVGPCGPGPHPPPPGPDPPAADPSSAPPAAPPPRPAEDAWAVVVNASRYWFNLRHRRGPPRGDAGTSEPRRAAAAGPSVRTRRLRRPSVRPSD